MHRATGCPVYRRQLERLVEVLLEFEMRFESRAGDCGFGISDAQGQPQPGLSRLPERCAAGADAGGVASWKIRGCPEVIERGIAAYRLAPQAIDLGTGGRIDTVGMASPDAAGEIGETAFWNFKAGLSLRFFGALRRSPDPAVQAVASRHRDRLAVFEAVLRHQLARVGRRARRLASRLRTSVLSGETNSETQPWAMLGLVGHPKSMIDGGALTLHTSGRRLFYNIEHIYLMPPIPTEALSAAEFIVRHLYRPARAGRCNAVFRRHRDRASGRRRQLVLA